MARQQATKDYRNFIKGLITEASALTFPENASLAEDNFTLHRNGKRQRRLGINTPDGAFSSDRQLDSNDNEYRNYAISWHDWYSPGGDITKHWGVLQVGDRIQIFDLLAQDGVSVVPVDASYHLSTPNVPLYPWGSGNTLIQESVCQSAVINGDLILVNSGGKPARVSFDTGTQTVAINLIDIKIRDLTGLNDGYAVDEEVPTLSSNDEHKYNLYNQGWNSTNLSGYFLYAPANNAVWFAGKDSSGNFSPINLGKIEFGTTYAPRGHYILDAFDRDRESVHTTAEPTSSLTLQRYTNTKYPTTVEYFAGRIWYAGQGTEYNGVSAPDFPIMDNMIFFSKVASTPDDLGICYQEADPSAEYSNELVDTDGGYITLASSGSIYKIVALNNNLFVFAEKGVWVISGRDGIFSATDYSTTKLSGVRPLSASSIVVADNFITFWSEAGIYLVESSDSSGGVSLTNLTDKTIQTLYNSINTEAKRNATGIYSAPNRTISWLYNSSSTYDGEYYRYKRDKELSLDLSLGAFYTYTFKDFYGTSSLTPSVLYHVQMPNKVASTKDYNVLDGSDQVVDGSDNIINTTNITLNRENDFQYLTIFPDSSGDYFFTFCSLNNTNYKDWEVQEGVSGGWVGETAPDAAAFMETGYELLDDTQRKKQINYITTFMERTETGFTDSGGELIPTDPSSCLVTVKWEFSDDVSSGLWTDQFEAYRLKRDYTPYGASDPFTYGQSVIVSKNKVRGAGRAFSIRFDTSPGKDLRLLGWGVLVSGGSAV